MLQPQFLKVVGTLFAPVDGRALWSPPVPAYQGVELDNRLARMTSRERRYVHQTSRAVFSLVASLQQSPGMSPSTAAACPERRKIAKQATLPLSFGSLGSIRSITKLPDGGRLLLGSFDVWYGGLRYRDVLRHDRTEHRTLTGVSSWTTATTSQLLLQGRGLLLVGGSGG